VRLLTSQEGKRRAGRDQPVGLPVVVELAESVVAAGRLAIVLPVGLGDGAWSGRRGCACRVMQRACPRRAGSARVGDEGQLRDCEGVSPPTTRVAAPDPGQRSIVDSSVTRVDTSISEWPAEWFRQGPSIARLRIWRCHGPSGSGDLGESPDTGHMTGRHGGSGVQAGFALWPGGQGGYGSIRRPGPATRPVYRSLPTHCVVPGSSPSRPLECWRRV
jgi:hypothetical protein